MIGSHLRKGLFIAASLLALSAVSAGCGDDTTETGTTSPTTTSASTGAGGTGGEGGSGEATPGDFSVTVNYGGTHMVTEKDSLTVFASETYPPMGAPMYVVSQPMPTFPFTGTLKGLKPGSYYVVAMLDIDPPNPEIPGKEDLLINSEPIEIKGGDNQSVTLTLKDQ